MTPLPQYNSSKNDHPFGMLMPGRSYSSTAYKYGFNGKEKDDEVKGVGNSLDFGARIYDNRLGRWLSVDPLQQKYVGFSPYNFAINSPLQYKDYDGRDLFAAGKQSQAMVMKALREAFGSDAAKGFEFDKKTNRLKIKEDTYDKLDLPIQKVLYEKFVKEVVNNHNLEVHAFNSNNAISADGTPVKLHEGSSPTHEFTWTKKTSEDCWYGELTVGIGIGGLAQIKMLKDDGSHFDMDMTQSEGFWHGIGHIIYNKEFEIDNTKPIDGATELKMIQADKKTVGFHNLFQLIDKGDIEKTYTGTEQHKMTITSPNSLYSHPYDGSGTDNSILREQPKGNPNEH